MKIEFDKKKELESVIKKSYFSDENGKLCSKKTFLKIEKKDPIYIMVKGLNNMTVRITNQEIVDGTVRFIVDDTHENYIHLIPCSIYCIVENEKYSFY